ELFPRVNVIGYRILNSKIWRRILSIVGSYMTFFSQSTSSVGHYGGVSVFIL
ncbi:hypothetical protein L9F63_009758, partial [Diploptera punctata]